MSSRRRCGVLSPASACRRAPSGGDPPSGVGGIITCRDCDAGGHNNVLMQKIRAAVIGVGYLGRFHAQKYGQAAGCELLAVVDQRQDVRDQIGAELKARALGDYRERLGAVDAVSVVTPTPAHFGIARDFLEHGAHVLVEKPITETASQARELIAL